MGMTNAQYDVEAAAQQVFALVVECITSGHVPSTVAGFSELHDHVDANEFLDEASVPYGTDLPALDDDPAGVRVVNAVTQRVDELLAQRLVHFLDFDACATVCGIADPDAGMYADPFGDGSGVTCPRCAAMLTVPA